jgi:nucleotide-binding universal stress UspA family protein
MFKSIVVAFDGSAHASRALDIGAEMSSQFEAPLGIIYVIDKSSMQIPDEMRTMIEVEHIGDPRPRALVDLQSAPSALVSRMAQVGSDSVNTAFEYADWLIGHAEECARRDGATGIESRVAEGDPAEQVVDFARQRDADLIVSGCRGMGRVKSALLGSVSSRILHLSEASCLTVK